jgi:hypothetical protein
MAEDREAQRVLDALEAYLAQVDTSRAVRKAFLAGVAVGRQCGARKLSTGSTGRSAPCRCREGVPPLMDPPSNPTPLQILSLPDPDPDLRSIECASARAPASPFALTPPALPPHRKLRRPLPEDMRLTTELRRFAEAGGLDAGLEFGAFKDHYRATGGVFSDWPAAFKSWCRKSFEFHARERRR